jgi:hypothetical protein
MYWVLVGAFACAGFESFAAAAWTAGRLSTVEPRLGRVAVAVDGKTVRGAPGR